MIRRGFPEGQPEVRKFCAQFSISGEFATIRAGKSLSTHDKPALAGRATAADVIFAPCTPRRITAHRSQFARFRRIFLKPYDRTRKKPVYTDVRTGSSFARALGGGAVEGIKGRVLPSLLRVTASSD
jgi:hypothetical protein